MIMKPLLARSHHMSPLILPMAQKISNHPHFPGEETLRREGGGVADKLRLLILPPGSSPGSQLPGGGTDLDLCNFQDN